MARLALQTGAPVIAVAMVGTRAVQPIGQAVPNLFLPVTVRFSAPLDFTRYARRASDPMVLRQITDEVMFELQALSGQEYVDNYCKRVPDDAVGPAELALVASAAG